MYWAEPYTVMRSSRGKREEAYRQISAKAAVGMAMVLPAGRKMVRTVSP